MNLPASSTLNCHISERHTTQNIDPSNAKVNLNCVCRFSSYRAVNTPAIGCKNRSANTVQRREPPFVVGFVRNTTHTCQLNKPRRKIRGKEVIRTEAVHSDRQTDRQTAATLNCEISTVRETKPRASRQKSSVEWNSSRDLQHCELYDDGDELYH